LFDFYWAGGMIAKANGFNGDRSAIDKTMMERCIGLSANHAATLRAIPERHSLLRRLFAFHNHAPDFFRRLRF